MFHIFSVPIEFSDVDPSNLLLIFVGVLHLLVEYFSLSKIVAPAAEQDRCMRLMQYLMKMQTHAHSTFQLAVQSLNPLPQEVDDKVNNLRGELALYVPFILPRYSPSFDYLILGYGSSSTLGA